MDDHQHPHNLYRCCFEPRTKGPKQLIVLAFMTLDQSFYILSRDFCNVSSRINAMHYRRAHKNSSSLAS